MELIKAIRYIYQDSASNCCERIGFPSKRGNLLHTIYGDLLITHVSIGIYIYIYTTASNFSFFAPEFYPSNIRTVSYSIPCRRIHDLELFMMEYNATFLIVYVGDFIFSFLIKNK